MGVSLRPDNAVPAMGFLEGKRVRFTECQFIKYIQASNPPATVVGLKSVLVDLDTGDRYDNQHWKVGAADIWSPSSGGGIPSEAGMEIVRLKPSPMKSRDGKGKDGPSETCAFNALIMSLVSANFGIDNITDNIGFLNGVEAVIGYDNREFEAKSKDGEKKDRVVYGIPIITALISGNSGGQPAQAQQVDYAAEAAEVVLNAVNAFGGMVEKRTALPSIIQACTAHPHRDNILSLITQDAFLSSRPEFSYDPSSGLIVRR